MKVGNYNYTYLIYKNLGSQLLHLLYILDAHTHESTPTMPNAKLIGALLPIRQEPA